MSVTNPGKALSSMSEFNDSGSGLGTLQAPAGGMMNTALAISDSHHISKQKVVKSKSNVRTINVHNNVTGQSYKHSRFVN